MRETEQLILECLLKRGFLFNSWPPGIILSLPSLVIHLGRHWYDMRRHNAKSHLWESPLSTVLAQRTYASQNIDIHSSTSIYPVFDTFKNILDWNQLHFGAPSTVSEMLGSCRSGMLSSPSSTTLTGLEGGEGSGRISLCHVISPFTAIIKSWVPKFLPELKS